MLKSIISFFKGDKNDNKSNEKPIESKKPVVKQYAPIQVNLKKGETYYYCTCGRTSNEPFCDGSHEGTQFKPMAFKAEKDESTYLWACKQTNNPPYCDGSHKNL